MTELLINVILTQTFCVDFNYKSMIYLIKRGGDNVLKSNLKYLRKSKGFDMTQQELAEKIGVTVVTIYKIESGRGANIRTAKKLSDVFGVSINELFDWEN